MPAALDLPGETIAVNPTPQRGRFGFIAEPALVQMFADVQRAVRGALADGDLPIIIGGDCPVMLGALAALENPGLVFVDGHEDAWEPTPDVRGETSDSELGIAIGFISAPVPAVVDSSRVVALGPRDRVEITEFGQRRIDDLVTMRDDAWVEAASIADLTEVLAPATASDWWLHIDLDVLSTDALAAVDYPQPGGLSWATLETVTSVALGRGGCRGVSVADYDPDLDAGAAAPRIAEFVRQLAIGLAA